MLGEIDGRHSLVGFAVAIAIIAVLFWFVGYGDVARAFALVRPWALVSVGAVALCWLLAWGLGLRTVLGSLDVDVGLGGAFLIQAAVQFTNNVTPFGQAGGEPISALLVSRSVDVEYETSLAAIASVDAINYLPSIAFAVVGLAYYGVAFTLGPRLRQAALVVLALVVLLGLVAYVGWRLRNRLDDLTVAALTPLLRAAGRVLPFRSSPSKAVVRAHVRGFYRDLGRLAGRPERLAVALVFSTLGWTCLVGSLWLSLYALGHAVPFPALLVVIPLAAVAGLAPLPGGLGSTEAVLVVLLVPITAVSPAVAGAAVLVHRTGTYWGAILVGGISAAFLSTTDRLRRAE